MRERSKLICKLQTDLEARTAYIKAKLGVLVPSQVKALRLRFDMPRQVDLATAAKMHQSRISMFETPGAANITLETISRLAAALKVGVIVKFVPFSDMLRWENGFSQDTFDVIRLDDDKQFLNPNDIPAVNYNQLADDGGGMAGAKELKQAVPPPSPMTGNDFSIQAS